MTGGWALLVVGVALLGCAAVAAPARALARAVTLRGTTARLTLAAAGALCVSAAAILLAGEQAQSSGTPLTAKITNELGSGQVSERIEVFIDGRAVGVIAVDRTTPKDELVVSVKRAGTHAYRLVSTRVLVGRKPATRTNAGEVTIDGMGPLVLYADDQGRVYLGQ